MPRETAQINDVSTWLPPSLDTPWQNVFFEYINYVAVKMNHLKIKPTFIRLTCEEFMLFICRSPFFPLCRVSIQIFEFGEIMYVMLLRIKKKKTTNESITKKKKKKKVKKNGPFFIQFNSL